MSPRKPTIDDLDDVDDEDGVLEDEARQETDLSLDLKHAEEVGLGGTRIGGEEEEDDEAANDWRDEDDEADQPEG